MSNSVGTLAQLAGEFARVFDPLARRVEDNTVDTLLEWLGLRASDTSAEAANLSGALTTGAAAAASLVELSDDLVRAVAQDDTNTIASTTVVLLQHFHTLVQAVRDIASALRTLSADPNLTAQQRGEITAFADVFVERLLNRLGVDYLETRFPHIALALIATGGIEIVREDGGPDGSLNGPYIRKTFHLERLMKLCTDPAGLLRNVYRWGDPGFDGRALFTTLQTLLQEKFAIPAEILQPTGEPALLEAFGFNAEVNPGLSPPGLDVSVRMPAAVDRTETIDAGDWQITFKTQGGVSGDLDATIRPFLDVELHLPQNNTADFHLAADFSRSATAPPVLMLGTAGGSRLEVQRLRANVRLDLHFDANAVNRAVVEPAVDFTMDDGKVILDSAHADGFLARILPEDGLTISFDFAGGWSVSRGFYLSGGAGLEATLPVHVDVLGVLRVGAVHVAVKPAGNNIQAIVATTATVDLGPMTAVVEQFGLQATLGLPPEGGNLGIADLELGFKPPSGIAIAIDTEVVAGGGFLLFEPEKHRYAGALVLEIGTVTVNAVGLLTTRLPDGREGFSLLISLAASGFTPIQLGLGFTLNGMGGLLGLNRSAEVEALRTGLKNNTLDAVLFPADPLAQLPHLVNVLERVFPVTEGRHLFGPAAIIGWGTPTRLTLELALILELPAPVRLIILGQLRAILPREDTPILQLKMDALGVVDFEQGAVSLDATLYDSRLLQFGLSGDMALRARWASDPGFVLAVGGLNPRFKPPAALNFPKLKRITIDFTRRNNPRLRLSAYLALTSNTLQIGARAELYVAISALSLQGALGFDVLIRVSPFGFVADLAGAVAVKWGSHTLLGISLEATLSGPDPLVIHGKGRVKVWIFSKSFDFDHTLGDADAPPPLPVVNPLPDLVAALEDPRSWSAQLPAGGHMLVALRQIQAAPGVVLAHPLGTLMVMQSVVPLNLTIERYGGATVAGDRRFTIDQVALGDDAHPLRQTLQDWFAPGEFLNLSDTERLARPSFERLDAGLRIGADEVAFGGDQTGQDALMAIAPIDYEETKLIGPDGQEVPDGPSYTPDPDQLTAAVALGAVARKGTAHAGRARYYGPPGGVEVVEAGYAVASAENLQPAGDMVASFSAALEALAALQTVAAEPEEPGEETATLQVIGGHLLKGVLR